MERNVFCWLTILAVTLWTPEICFGRSEAASGVAARLYESGSQQLYSKQWKKAVWAFEIASLLDPGFEAASLKSQKLQKALRSRVEQQYIEGLRAYQSLRYEEAKLHWQLACQSLLDSVNPLKPKLEKALSLVEFSFTLPSPSPLVGEGRGEGGKDPTRETMEGVKTFLETGNTAQAMLSLKEILYKDGDHFRAQNVLTRLQDSFQKEEGSKNLSDAIHSQFAKAESFLKEAKQAQAKNEDVAAYEKYRSALSLFQGDDLKPPFYNEIVSGVKEIEGKLQEELKPLLAKWESDLEKGSGNLKEIGLKLKEVIKKYPPSDKAQALLQKTFALLQAKAEPILIKAKTTQELEGCRSAIPSYTDAKEIAIFTEVPAWQEANKNLEGCFVIGEN